MGVQSALAMETGCCRGVEAAEWREREREIKERERESSRVEREKREAPCRGARAWREREREERERREKGGGGFLFGIFLCRRL